MNPRNRNRFRTRYQRPTRQRGKFRRANKPKSSLGKNVNIFIKKASSIAQNTQFTPRNSFESFDLANPLKQNIANKGYATPTPIQDQAIWPLLEGRDLIGVANTGTGKTAAFLIPIINILFKDRSKRALIIAPTRELATQIQDECKSFAHHMRIYSTLAIGGTNIRRQMNELYRNPQIVIATPGRLTDLIQRKAIDLKRFNLFVLDEVDMMLDIGFIKDIQYFLTLLPQVRQSIFFSATIPPKVRDIVAKFVQKPITISVKQQDTAENIDQDVIHVTDLNKKVDQLHELLIKDEFSKVLIFGRTKRGVEKLNKELTARGFRTGAIHGNKKQGARQRTLESFKKNQIQVLLATDVASRGLDIDNVTHVINYDMPETYNDYIHRIGRTGRADKKGRALTFVEG
jgi:ATP-dependent RNA helicase RhlE